MPPLTNYDILLAVRKITLAIILVSLFSLPLFACFAKTALPTPTATLQPEYDFAKMTTYELFWPISAGVIPGDRFYSLKNWRDVLVEKLIFSEAKKSEYLKVQANKKLVETEKLIEIKRQPFIKETLEKSSWYLENGLALLSRATESSFSLWLREEYRKDLKKHLVVLGRLAKTTQGEDKILVEKAADHVKAQAAKYKIEIFD